ncbi:hypothetical protein Hanom_Chr14g01269821 [Helianthus anomalus]
MLGPFSLLGISLRLLASVAKLWLSGLTEHDGGISSLHSLFSKPQSPISQRNPLSRGWILMVAGLWRSMVMVMMSVVNGVGGRWWPDDGCRTGMEREREYKGDDDGLGLQFLNFDILFSCIK